MNQRLWYKVYKDNNQVGRRKYITAQYGSKEEVENLLESHKAFSKLKEYTLGLEDQNEDEEAWESVTSLPKGDITVIISHTAAGAPPAPQTKYYTPTELQPYGAMGVTPSGIGHSTYYNLQTQGTCKPFLRDNRPYSNYDLPITLLSPHFGKFLTMLNCTDPTKADERYSLDLCGILADFYRHGERSKLEVFNLKFAEYMGLPITRLCLTPSVQNDGSILVDPRSAAAQALCIEHKWEADHGGADPQVQNVGHHYLHTLQRPDSSLLPGSPTFCIQTTAEYISIGGIVSADKEVFQPLTPAFPGKNLLALDRSVNGLNHQLARALTVLKLCVRELFDEYSRQQPALDSHLNLPFPLTDGRYTDIRRLNAPGSFLFICLKDGVKCMVKYTQQCCPETMQSLSDAQLSPKLISAARLPDNQYYEVAHELCDGNDGWRSPSQIPDSAMADARAEAFKVMKACHKMGIVLGDPKSDNFLIRLEKNMVAEAKVCDLEWAGQEETAIFPPWMNHADLEWPEGAETGTPILKEHDVAFFDKAWDKMEALKRLSPETRKRGAPAKDRLQFAYAKAARRL